MSEDTTELLKTIAGAAWLGAMFYVFTVIMFCF